MQVGDKYTSKLIVSESTTALHMGSGDLLVLATPAMIALMENAAMKLVSSQIPQESTTVGAEMNVSHLKATPIGAEISAEATLIEIDNRKLTFDVIATQGDTIIGKGTHVRYIVDKERFMSKLK